MLKLTEQELKEFATEQSKTIVIRTYEDGNSKDERRKSLKLERRIIESIIYGGLLAIKDCRNSIEGNREGNKQEKEIQAIINSCEYIAIIQIPEMNGYDTIYIPMQEWRRNNII